MPHPTVPRVTGRHSAPPAAGAACAAGTTTGDSADTGSAPAPTRGMTATTAPAATVRSGPRVLRAVRGARGLRGVSGRAVGWRTGMGSSLAWEGPGRSRSGTSLSPSSVR